MIVLNKSRLLLIYSDLQITLEDRSKIFKLGIYNSDMHYDFCGKCEEIGKLICCETCSSAYHYECLGYEKVI